MQLIRPTQLIGAARFFSVSARTAATFKNVIFEVRGSKKNVGYIQMNHPKVNAMSDEHIRDILAAMKEHDANPAVGCMILTGGTGKVFCAGANIDEMKRRDYRKVVKDDFIAIWDDMTRIKKPIVAAVNGVAFGGGCEIAMACDIMIASAKAVFGQPEIKLGIIPGYGGTQRLARLIGKGRALQIILTGDMIKADEALRIGLVNEVVAAAELMPRAEALAVKIIANAPIAARYCLEAVNKGMDMTLAEGLAHEAALFGLCFATADKKEGTGAFLEKRAPQFKGV